MTSPFPPGVTVSAYLRDSGGEGQDDSIQQQENAFLAWCNANALIPGAIFRDAARPGSSIVGRQGFQDMMYHFRTGAPEAGLVIWSYSRFARDIDDAQFHRADLRRRGYILHSLNDDIPTGSMGRLFEAAIDWKNEQFLFDLSRDVKRGLHDLVATYGAVPGTPPRGFKREPIDLGQRRDGQPRTAHRWVPDPSLTPLIRLAFDMRAQGCSLAEIHAATHLYSSLNSYQTFYRNRLYIGILDYGGLVVENYCQPVVDLETWQVVQTVLDEHAKRINLNGSKHPRRVHSAYLLSGLAHCARCGSPLFGQTSPQRARTHYQRYACTRAKRRHDCDLRPIPRKVLENAVISDLRQYILQPGLQLSNQAIIQEQNAERLAGLRANITPLKKQLAALRRQITRVTDAIAEAGHTRALLAKLTDLERQEADLLGQINQLERQLQAEPTPITHDELIDQITNIHMLLDNEDIETLRPIIRGLVSRVVVDRQDVSVIGEIIYFHPP